jgi:hypothetical protein
MHLLAPHSRGDCTRLALLALPEEFVTKRDPVLAGAIEIPCLSLTLHQARPAARRDQVNEPPSARQPSAPPPAVAEGAIL